MTEPLAMPMKRHIVLVLTVVAALLGCATGKNIDHDLSLTLPSQLELALKAHSPRAAPPMDLAVLERTTEVDHKGNFGKLTYETEQANLRWIDNGRASNESRSLYTGPDGSKSQGSRRTASLCGLVDVLAEQGSEGTSRLTMAVSTGGPAVVPISLTPNVQVLGRYRLRSFEASVPNICMPSPGMVFSYKYTAERQRRSTQSPFRGNMLFEVSDAVTCRVGANSKPSTTLSPSLKGQYLDVACRHTEPGKPERSTSWAFLQESGRYIPLKLQLTDYETHTSKYTASTYR